MLSFRTLGLQAGEHVRPLVIATSSTAGCVAGAGTILRSINTILTGSVPPAENEALTATFAVLVPDNHKS